MYLRSGIRENDGLIENGRASCVLYCGDSLWHDTGFASLFFRGKPGLSAFLTVRR